MVLCMCAPSKNEILSGNIQSFFLKRNSRENYKYSLKNKNKNGKTTIFFNLRYNKMQTEGRNKITKQIVKN